MIASMTNAKGMGGEAMFSAFDLGKIAKRAEKWAAKMAGGGRIANKAMKMHGSRECARRMRQMKAGTATPNYVHGGQYGR